ncbi:MAG: hypothetical protein WCI30_08930 [Clostridia bacterium]
MGILRNKMLVISIITVLLFTGCSAPAASTPAPENAEQTKQISTLQAEVIAKDSQILDLTTKFAELQALSSSSSATLLQTSLNVMQAIKDKDMNALAAYVHPTLGVRFSPYAHIDLVNHLSFAAINLPALLTDPTVYTWGSFDGSGDPINYKFSDYYDNFIYDEDYLNPHLIGNNTIIGKGNLINNIATAYPSASFVEFHFTGFDPQYTGLDWTSLILVFENVSGNWLLVGIVHSQWTI